MKGCSRDRGHGGIACPENADENEDNDVAVVVVVEDDSDGFAVYVGTMLSVHSWLWLLGLAYIRVLVGALGRR